MKSAQSRMGLPALFTIFVQGRCTKLCFNVRLIFCQRKSGTDRAFGDNMEVSDMPSLCRHGLLRTLVILPSFLLAGTAWAGAAPISSTEQSAAAQTSGTESPLPVFEMHSGFWVNLHHFLYLQARLLKGNSSSTETGRGAAQPDELPVSLIDFAAADIRAWQDAVTFYSRDLAGRDLLAEWRHGNHQQPIVGNGGVP